MGRHSLLFGSQGKLVVFLQASRSELKGFSYARAGMLSGWPELPVGPVGPVAMAGRPPTKGPYGVSIPRHRVGSWLQPACSTRKSIL